MSCDSCAALPYVAKGLSVCLFVIVVFPDHTHFLFLPFANLDIGNLKKDISKTITASSHKFSQLVDYLVKLKQIVCF